jgi:non-specific serine/threonine protein kinase
MSKKQRDLYESVRSFYAEMLREKVNINLSSKFLFVALLRLRQICLLPSLIDTTHNDIPSTKFEALTELLTEIICAEHKVLIFSQFVKVLNHIKAFLFEKKIPFCYLDGQTKDRGQEINKFQNSPDHKCFLISLKAGGTGINLTAAD